MPSTLLWRMVVEEAQIARGERRVLVGIGGTLTASAVSVQPSLTARVLDGIGGTLTASMIARGR